VVGTEFFEGAAARFIDTAPPRSAYLNDYGASFPAFLAEFPPAAGVPYLPGLARLEWAVSKALHAPDAASLDLTRLAAVADADQGKVSFIPHPSVALVHETDPVDRIWQAVLDEDDAAMAAIDLGEGPIWLIVARGLQGVVVDRLDATPWEFARRLVAGQSIDAAADAAPEANAAALIAAHLAAGHFIAFQLDILP
jgi:hypothetical protein